MADSTLEALVDALQERAARPAERALTLPPACYWHEGFWQLEQERIFRREWLCVGRSAELPNPGDWLRVDPAGEPLVVIRDQDGVLRALSRVCRHRSMDMLPDAGHASGNSAMLTCPYHLWSYRLDGRLRAAPMMDANEAHDPASCTLPSFPLTEWQGFIFVCLDNTATPLTTRMKPFEQLLGGVDMTGWREAGRVDWGESQVNWKVALENFAEFYHHIGTHRDSLQVLWPANLVTLDMRGGSDFMAGWMAVNPELASETEAGHPIQPTPFPPVAGLEPARRGGTLVAAAFPLFALALNPDSALWFDWHPTGPESHTLTIRLLVPPETLEMPGFDAILAEHLEAVRAVQAEDARANEAVQAGVRSPHATSGALADLERPLWQFQRYLAQRLCDREQTEARPGRA